MVRGFPASLPHVPPGLLFLGRRPLFLPSRVWAPVVSHRPRHPPERRKMFSRHFVATIRLRSPRMLLAMSRISRGMLQVKGVTYRIERNEPHCYCVVRLLDDTEVGTFRTRPQLRISSAQIELTLLRDIVRA